ncbi:GNAT family N-acetyltransferase [Algibacter sp. L4_22]|uniref:GNAT family N-acetyltransferase n=1 Tax=Algibacter sp. L4_22 TaxID=2942477 RepID=UPI00201B8A9A|nr:GNAT family N-acetyltransferase [Algibacter sp. L4_22]MCL5128950.1 GNAT family N-acetyltransferase [Algibacter sp. L4_22]
MPFIFKIIEEESIDSILPLIQKLNNNQVLDTILRQRFVEMFSQNYECAGLFKNEELIGVCGLWFCTRHYSGRSVEVDHVFIDEKYRGQRLGKLFFEWIYNYTKNKGFEAIELNTYVSNHGSHKFYFNEGFKILGYHFLKKM